MTDQQIETVMQTALLASMRKAYTIRVDNSSAQSFNINIDTPSFFCYALSKEEAVGKMMLSDFAYKHKPIVKIHEHK